MSKLLDLLRFNICEDAHPLGSIGDICFHKDKLISVADDSLIKIFEVQNKDLKLEHQFELEEEPHSESCNQLNQLALGGKNKMVNIYNIDSEKPLELKDPVLAFKMDSPIRKVMF